MSSEVIDAGGAGPVVGFSEDAPGTGATHPAQRLGWILLLLVLITTLATTVAAHAAPADGAGIPTPMAAARAVSATNTTLLPPTPPAEVPGSVAFPLFRMVFALALVLGVLFGGAWLFRRMPELLGPRGTPPRLRVLEVRTLGGKHALFVIAYDRQRLLVGSSPHGIGLIDRLPDEDLPVAADPRGTAAPASFAAALGQFLRPR